MPGALRGNGACRRYISFTITRQAAMKISIPLLCAATGLTLMHGVIAADLTDDDQRFLREAGEHSLLQKQAGELAMEKANHPHLKRYAGKILDDHGPAHKELEVLASAKGFTLPIELDGSKRGVMEDLRQLKDAGFDRQYADEVAADAHEDAVELYEDVAEDTNDAEIKAYAEKRLPMLKQHLASGQELEELIENTRRNADAVK